MCGIIAYLGDGETVAVLLEGLKRMEYRGYDSSGMCVITRDGAKLEIEKQAGKVANLEQAVAGRNFKSNASLGIAHTRWATHGPPTAINAHPHASSDGKLAIVHNGIIENHSSLKKKLSAMGYEFVSDTDTEVLAALIRHVQSLEPNLSLAGAVSLALTQVRGAYGIAVVDESKPDVLVGARRGSPLILGVSDDSLVLASDATAVVGLTAKVVYLEEEDIVSCQREHDQETGKTKYSFSVSSMKRDSLLVEAGETSAAGGDEGADQSAGVFSSEDEGPMMSHKLDSRIMRQMTLSNKAISGEVIRQMHELKMNLQTIEKGGYRHFMLKEIMEQPRVLRDCMRGRLDPLSGKVTLGGLMPALDRLAKARRIIICGCGTSWHAALVGEYLIETLAKIPVEVEYASEFRYRNPVLFKDDVVIVISQSGETADTLEAVRVAKKHGCLCVGIVNIVGSSIARETDAGIYLHIGPEIGVASTKAFTGQVMALSMFTLVLAVQTGALLQDEANRLGLELAEIPDKIARMLNEDTLNKIQNMASTYRYAHNFLYLGRGTNFPVALEGALKLKEISYIHAEGYAAAEMKHGPIALIDEMMPVVILAPKSDVIYEKVKSGVQEVVARKGSVVIITDEGNHDLDDLAEFVIETPITSEYFSAMITGIPLQLLAYYIADYRGCEIDTPRNLAKSVTVE
ncbi:Glutamine--fructose-6-phosphate aminotransferase isomerizing [Hondaea fermentalgiana]|uniref:Glutamine--fructose-6-phosphate aminotransferase [isomerizing] n=1 Tax=Hondaea fermentalgiana TaxID=2315210 RepID=A0A2R5GRI4_9STRA|nr:Glutamine--fructose-6-phosphate aminotransferase isomerizing [Hondaea fermentalgiana]|eukprot:GBG33205.1 Glutamine--fructose-6-phosphate aminotransferase isomerizing [Hondaea fermentalgiana]